MVLQHFSSIRATISRSSLSVSTIDYAILQYNKDKLPVGLGADFNNSASVDTLLAHLKGVISFRCVSSANSAIIVGHSPVQCPLMNGPHKHIYQITINTTHVEGDPPYVRDLKTVIGG